MPAEALRWCDRLRSQKKRASTVCLKLSVVRSFFEYLKATAVVPFKKLWARIIGRDGEWCKREDLDVSVKKL